ncbi:MAG: L-threonylcarbamoyladenylate synthase [Actinobacteria bacterium]|nr:L-threonylcarbamoyladenylate synthase [Cyanobacteriota bacterium]MCL5770754.1 L-threonylcarbamoyladenylate synthase [Actinomycetota bacterium]
MNNLKIKQKVISYDNIKKISDFIKNGKIIILPAKTIYGLSCRFDLEDSLKRICDIKGRNKAIPFIILISKIEDLFNFTSEISEDCKKLINYYWNKDNPDSVTMIFKKNSKIADFITSGKNTIAIRRAEFKFVREIIDNSYPLVSTSATISGIKKNPVKLEDIDERILQKVDLIVEFEEELNGVESTIIDTTGSEIKLIREGTVSFNSILQKLQIKI